MHVWPKTQINPRGDSHFSCPEVQLLRRVGLSGLTPTKGSRRLRKARWSRSGACTGTRDAPCDGSPRSPIGPRWSAPQRVVCKAEASERGENVRFVVTNLIRGPPSSTRRSARGRMEGFIKNHKTFLQSGSHLLPRLQGQSLPALPPFGRLCPAAYPFPHRTKGRQVRPRQLRYDPKSSAQIAGRVCEMKTKVVFHPRVMVT